MQVSEATIIKDVRVAIDENTSVTPFTDESGNIFDPDTLEMEEIIKSKIPDGINAVRAAAPISMLAPARKASGTDLTVTWTDEEKGIGHIALPDDYLRLVMFKMSDWAHAVSVAVSPDSPLYHQQFSEWKGVRGNPSRPVIAFATDMETGEAVLQFFSCDNTEAKAELTYIQRSERQESDDGTVSYEIENAVYRPVLLKTAALVAATYSNADMVNLLNQLAQEMLNL